MADATFNYRYFIQAEPASIYAHLADPSNYIGLSPLLTHISDVQRGLNSQGRETIRYVSNERFRFAGILTYNNPLRVTLTLTQPNVQLVSEVISTFWVNVRFVFDLQPEDGGTWITETVNAHMPWFERGFVVSEAKRVQQERARILTERMETASATA